MLCKAAGLSAVVICRIERYVFFGQPYDFMCEDAEFFPYRCQSVFFQLLLQLACVDLVVVSMQEHRPVAQLAESYSFREHMPYGVVQDEEGVECLFRQVDSCAEVVVACSCAVCYGV